MTCEETLNAIHSNVLELLSKLSVLETKITSLETTLDTVKQNTNDLNVFVGVKNV